MATLAVSVACGDVHRDASLASTTSASASVSSGIEKVSRRPASSSDDAVRDVSRALGALPAQNRSETRPLEVAFDSLSSIHVNAALANTGPSAHNQGACPAGMTLVEGNYCPEVEQTCLEWLDPPTSRYAHFRCARYAKPAKCNSPRRVMRFCIETTEHREADSDLPVHGTSWTDGARTCAADGGRLCKASEWQFACEGEEMRPYPYGWERDPTACNVDVMTGLGRVGKLVDHRMPASAHPRCVSPFGVHDMAGNVDEWVTVEGKPVGQREVMKGSWWMPGRHACRSFQGGHGAHYGGAETGMRCCRDARSALAP